MVSWFSFKGGLFTSVPSCHTHNCVVSSAKVKQRENERQTFYSRFFLEAARSRRIKGMRKPKQTISEPSSSSSHLRFPEECFPARMRGIPRRQVEASSTHREITVRGKFRQRTCACLRSCGIRSVFRRSARKMGQMLLRSITSAQSESFGEVQFSLPICEQRDFPAVSRSIQATFPSLLNDGAWYERNGVGNWHRWS